MWDFSHKKTYGGNIALNILVFLPQKTTLDCRWSGQIQVLQFTRTLKITSKYILYKHRLDGAKWREKKIPEKSKRSHTSARFRAHSSVSPKRMRVREVKLGQLVTNSTKDDPVLVSNVPVTQLVILSKSEVTKRKASQWKKITLITIGL